MYHATYYWDHVAASVLRVCVHWTMNSKTAEDFVQCPNPTIYNQPLMCFG